MINNFCGVSKIWVNRHPWRRDLEYVILGNHTLSENGKPKYSRVSKIEFTELGECEDMKPSGVMSFTDAQELMDQLWTCGLRPTEGTGSAGALKAIECHLEDMRALVFDSKGEKCLKK